MNCACFFLYSFIVFDSCKSFVVSTFCRAIASFHSLCLVFLLMSLVCLVRNALPVKMFDLFVACWFIPTLVSCSFFLFIPLFSSLCVCVFCYWPVRHTAQDRVKVVIKAERRTQDRFVFISTLLELGEKKMFEKCFQDIYHSRNNGIIGHHQHWHWWVLFSYSHFPPLECILIKNGKLLFGL